MSDDLPQFLLARIAEDEATARAAIKQPAPADADAVRVVWYRHDTGWIPSGSGEWAEGQALFERWDPARVLAECAAKRRIVELHDGEDDACLEPGFSSPGNCDTLRLLAQPYADHEGFREEWKVQ